MKQKISTLQGILLIMSTITPTAILTVPSIVVRFSGQDSWISIVMATIAGAAIASLIVSICRHNRSTTFPDFLKERLGVKPAMCIGILLAYYYFTTLLVIVREFVNFLAEHVLTRTPEYILIVLTVAVVMYAASQGIEVIARINVIVILCSFLIVVGTAVLLIKDIHPRFLLPVWDHSWLKIIQGGIIPASWFSEVSVLLLVAPFLNHPAAAGKVGIWGVVVAGMELCVIVIAAVTVLGPRLITHMTYPTFNLMGIIQIVGVLERIDILIITIWIGMMYVKMSIFMFGALHCFVHTCGIQSEAPFLFPLGLLAVLSSLYSWPRSSELIYFTAYPLGPYLLTVNVLLPLAIWFCLRMKRFNTLGAGK